MTKSPKMLQSKVERMAVLCRVLCCSAEQTNVFLWGQQRLVALINTEPAAFPLQ